MLDAVRLTTLDNGLRVVSSELSGAESISTGIWIGVGGRHEPASLTGISHFLEHMVFKGTRTRSARAISNAVEGRGGDLNAFTQEDSTCFYARVPYERMRLAVNVLSDMYRHARISEQEVERERAVVQEEIRMYRDQPQHLAQEIAMQTLWSRHALGRPLAGSEASIRALRAADLIRFRDRHYSAANTVFAFAGRLSHEACVAAVAHRLADMLPGAPERARPLRARSPQLSCATASRGDEQFQVVAAWRIFGRHDPRRYTLRLLNALVGENMSSRLFQVLRERHGLAYAIHSHYQLFAETGLFAVSAGVEQGGLEKALRLIGRELLRLREQPVAAAELQRARDYVLGQFRLGMESPGNQMQWLGENLLSYDRLVDPESVVSAVRLVGAREIRDLALDLFDPARLSLVVVSPRGLSADVEQLRGRL